ERFRRPSKRRHMGYFVGDVDAICDRVYAQLNSEEPLDPSVVRHAKFRPASGTVSYEESQVDAFLDRCIELLQDLL
ncbi:MAG: cell division protein DivIVA, partial [Rothia mucilaginosa]